MRCVICEASLAGRRRDATTCGSACRRERSRLRALLSGKAAGGFESVNAYLDHHYRAPGGSEGVRDGGEKAGAHTGRAAVETRSTRAARFVVDRCRETPGHVTTARSIYAAYLRWCVEHEPGAPMPYATFLRTIEGWAPIEQRVKVPNTGGGRGRPRVAYAGIRLSRAPSP